MNIQYIKGKGDGYWGRPYKLIIKDRHEYARGFAVGLNTRMEEGKVYKRKGVER